LARNENRLRGEKNKPWLNLKELRCAGARLKRSLIMQKSAGGWDADHLEAEEHPSPGKGLRVVSRGRKGKTRAKVLHVRNQHRREGSTARYELDAKKESGVRSGKDYFPYTIGQGICRGKGLKLLTRQAGARSGVNARVRGSCIT